MDKIAKVESVAAVMPCLFCGERKVIKIITLCGCKERNYADVSFSACLDCSQKIGTEIIAAIND